MKKRIISYICATVIILSSCYISVKAQVEKSYTSDGGYFTVDGYDQTVYVDTNGTRYSYYLNKETNSVSLEYRGGTEDVVVPESVNGVTVTSIGGNEGKKKLKSMSMPE